jgi:hypothetical protein
MLGQRWKILHVVIPYHDMLSDMGLSVLFAACLAGDELGVVLLAAFLQVHVL